MQNIFCYVHNVFHYVHKVFHSVTGLAQVSVCLALETVRYVVKMVCHTEIFFMIMFCQFYIACCRDFFIWCMNVIMMVMSHNLSYRRKNTTTLRRRMDSEMTILLKKLGVCP